METYVFVVCGTPHGPELETHHLGWQTSQPVHGFRFRHFFWCMLVACFSLSCSSANIFFYDMPVPCVVLAASLPNKCFGTPVVVLGITRYSEFHTSRGQSLCSSNTYDPWPPIACDSFATCAKALILTKLNFGISLYDLLCSNWNILHFRKYRQPTFFSISYVLPSTLCDMSMAINFAFSLAKQLILRDP